MELVEGYSIINQQTLKGAREKSGYSIEYVSRILGVHPNILKEYEEFPGNVYPSTAMRLAEVYGVSIDDIIFNV